MPEKIEVQERRPPRIPLDPKWDGNACFYLTAHAAHRLEERFGLSSLKHTPFSVFTHYCEPDNIDRPVWVIPISGNAGLGYILGRWEQAMWNHRYRYWFVGTTCITEEQFKNSHLQIIKSVKVNVIRVMNQLRYWRLNGINGEK